MNIDFSKLSVSSQPSILEPRDIFMSLPQKDGTYSYPRDVQTEVWKQWFEQRNNKNTIIKMNTGSGKTVVGLTILQSCLNEGKGPAIYVVPDNYLVEQVCSEAKKLGIKVAYDHDGIKGEDDYFFKTNKAILVINIHKLVNGKSVFGLNTNCCITIGSIIIDDVHACLDTIEQQYTIKIESTNELYSKIINRFKSYHELESNQTFFDITCDNPDPCKKMLMPFWIWQDSCEPIRRMLHEKSDLSCVIFNLPLISDIWKTCNCVITSRCIEISPKCIPISKICNFERAERKIFMSATLADDSVFVSTMGLSPSDITIITPEKANDIGERLILFPKHLNPEIGDKAVRDKIVEIAHNFNCVVIVPSFERAKFWEQVANEIPFQQLSSKDNNIQSGIAKLKSGQFTGLTILINKYDGIDLPEDACRFLVIDGLPQTRSEYDSVIQSMNFEDKRICSEQIQKIEQGMGRGVRSNNDYCVVVLMGSKLADVIINQNGKSFFSNATQKQYEISSQLWDQLMNNNNNPNINQIFELADYVTNRDTGWISLCKGALASVEYAKEARVSDIVIAKRLAFDQECCERYEEAFSTIERAIASNSDLSDKEKSMLMQLMAEYRNFSNPEQAQEILLTAYKLNNSALRPKAGIQYQKLQAHNSQQGKNVVDYISKNQYNPNTFIIRVDSILDDLRFEQNTSKQFENAVNELANILGFSGEMSENKGGPDNLWAIDNLTYYVIECKNGVKESTTEISKSDCAQLLSSIQWFENTYKGNSFTCVPIMIHRSSIFNSLAAPDSRMRIITETKLNDLKQAVKTFSRAITQNHVWGNAIEIQKVIVSLKLSGNAIPIEFTVKPNSVQKT